MPRTRRAEARAAAERQLLELPADVLSLVLYQLPLAHDIALTALTCRSLCDAAKLAFKARPFSGEVVTLRGHRQLVTGLAATADGRIITAPHFEPLKMWRDGTCVRTIRTHAVNGIALLPGGTCFLTCAYSDGPDGDPNIKLWTVDGDLKRSYDDVTRSDVHSIAALPDGVHFVVGLGGGRDSDQVKLYHVDGTLVHTFREHDDDVNALVVTRDGQHIISGSDDELVKVWSVASKSLVSTCRGHAGSVKALAAMPDGQRILSGGGSRDYTVRVWLLDGTLKNTFRLHDNDVCALVALPDNQHALSGSADHTVKLFNVNDGAVLRNFTHHARGVWSLALLPDGLRFVSGGFDGTACILEHGLACEPSQAWIDAKPKRDALTAAVAAARTARELDASVHVRDMLKRRAEDAQLQVEELRRLIEEQQRHAEQARQRIERLHELEEEVQAAAGDPPRLQEAQSRLSAEIGGDGPPFGDLSAYMVQ